MSNMRTFETGATRNVDENKIDPEGFLSPLVIQAFSDYMNVHRKQADGSIRASDNWQKGIPKDAYMKSMWRHFLDVWSIHRGIARFDETGKEIDKVEALCATLFNVQGMLHEELKSKDAMNKLYKIGWDSATSTSYTHCGIIDTSNCTGTVTAARSNESLSEQMLRCSVDNCIDK